MFTVNEEQRRIDLGERLRKLRTSRGLKQADIAKELSISPTAYMHYERGRREPSIKNLIIISHIFDISIDSLLGEKTIDFLDARSFWKSIGYGVDTDKKSSDIIFLVLPTTEELSFTKTGNVELLDKQDKVIVFEDKAAFVKFTDYVREKINAITYEKKKQICADISSSFYEKSKKV